MKKFKAFALSAVSCASLFLLGACGSDSSKENDEIKTSIDEKTEITFWHAMQGPQEKALQKLTKDFEKQNPKIKVTLQNQGQYKDLQSKITSTLQSPKDLPTMTQAYPTWLYQVAQEDMLVDLKPYMDNEKIGWGKQEAINADFLKGAQIDDKQYGIPFSKSTEVLYYNADLLKKYGVKVPTTMDELKKASETIYKKSKGKVVGAGFDSLSNYYVTGLKNEGVTFSKDVKLDSSDSKKVISYLADGVKAGYFRTAGADQYLSTPFANQKVAMYIGSSAGEGFVKQGAQGKFQYGVANYPAKYAMQQGADLFIFKNADSTQRTAAFEFMKFLASPKSQAYWAKETGYIPVVNSVKKSAEYKKTSKVADAISKATNSYFTVPVTENSNTAYNETLTIMEKILANVKDKNLDDLIKDSTPELEDSWNQ